MSNYSRGADFERAFVKALQANPETIYAARSAGSHGAIDVIRVWRRFGGPTMTTGYQLKRGRKPSLSDSELQELTRIDLAGMRIRIAWLPNGRDQKIRLYTLIMAKKLLRKKKANRSRQDPARGDKGRNDLLV